MKKLILSLAMVFSVTFAYSQLFNMGVKVGYNSTLSLNDLHYNTQKFSEEFFGNMHFGGFARLNFGKVYLQPELLYSMQRKDYRLSINNPELPAFDNLVKIRTIDMPILVGYKLLDFKLINVRTFIGPKFRFNAGSKITPSYATDRLAIDAGGPVTNLKDAALGLEAGVGVDVLMLTFDVRYNYTGNLYETTWSSTGNALKGISSSGLILTLGWKIL